MTPTTHLPAIALNNLRKTYDNGFEALKGIDLEVAESDFFALLGPNGAGKSTTIGILCSLVNKSGGEVNIFDANIDHDFPKAKSYLGVVPQEFNFSVFEKPAQIVMQQAGYYGMEHTVAEQRTEHYLKKLGLWEKRNVMSRTLSGGQKRRLMIARALVHEPRILILDEPTAGVDIEIRHEMWEFLQEINQQGVTIVLTTHYLEEAENLCRNIGIINHGELVHHSSMRALLRQLQKETYVLDITAPPAGALPDTMRLRNDGALEIDVPKGALLGEVFDQLNAAGVEVSSLRNKSNRLEQLFLGLVKSDPAASHGDS